jgi:glucose dehydrogenase
MSPRERKTRWRRIVLVLGIALVTLVGAAAAFVVTRQEGDVSNPDVEFREEPSATPEPEVEPDEPGGKKTDPVDRFIWAHYGYTRDRRRYLPLKRPLHPPFREIWQYQGNVLLEFPPVIGGKRLYLLNDHGVLYGIDKHTGKVRWRRKLGALAAASPAYAGGVVYVVLLARADNAKAGRVVALDGKSGKIKWSKQLASRSESSPRVADGRVYSFSASGGKLAWSHSTGGYVYGSPAVAAVPGSRPLVYIGSYSGRFYALDARSGAERWSRGGNGKISGGASVIGDIVYYADLGNKRTIGLDARSGRKVFEHERGSYNPVVSDGETIYLTGYHAMYGLVPLSAQDKRKRKDAEEARAARQARDRRVCTRKAREAHRGRPRSIRRSIERCRARKQERRRAAIRHECAQRARKAHRGRKGRIERSYQICVKERGVQRR